MQPLHAKVSGAAIGGYIAIVFLWASTGLVHLLIPALATATLPDPVSGAITGLIMVITAYYVPSNGTNGSTTTPTK